MAVTIDQIKELREATGVSMMACKKALEEANGDATEAVTILRKKGETSLANRAQRSTFQGAVVVKSKDSKYAMVSLLCETDFVAKGEDFLKVAEVLADKLLKGEIKPSDRNLPEVKDLALKLGENIQIGGMKLMEGKNIGEYVHSNKKIGVLVSLQGGNNEVARDVAMHVAATNPRVISPEEIARELVEKEKEIWREQLKSEGKPLEILEKIMFGKEKKFREENALLKQLFVKNPEITIEQLLKNADAAIKEFERFGI